MRTETAVSNRAVRRLRLNSVGKKLSSCDDSEAMFKMASTYTGESVASLKRTYGHLSPGLLRMNLGNRMRGAVRAARRTAQ